MSNTILRLPHVRRKTGLSRSTIYLRASLGEFPKPIHLGPRCVGWVEAEIDQWLNSRIQASRKAQAIAP